MKRRIMAHPATNAVLRHIHPKILKVAKKSRIWLEVLSCGATVISHARALIIVSAVWIAVDILLIVTGQGEA